MTCGKTLGKDRRPFSGRPYSALFEMVRDHKAATGQALSAAEIHCVLASTPSYVCKLCNSALSKYEGIMKQVDVIKTFMTVFNIEPAASLPVIFFLDTIRLLHVLTWLKCSIQEQNEASTPAHPTKRRSNFQSENLPVAKRSRLDATNTGVSAQVPRKNLFPRRAFPVTAQSTSPNVTVRIVLP